MEANTELQNFDFPGTDVVTPIEPIEKEKVVAMNENVIAFDNQEVLVNLGESGGMLTYKGALVGQEPFPSSHYFYPGELTAYTSYDGTGVALFVPSNTIPDGAIVETIYLEIDGKIDINNVSSIDTNVYVVNKGQVTYSSAYGALWLATIWCPFENSEIIQNLLSGTIGVEVEYR